MFRTTFAIALAFFTVTSGESVAQQQCYKLTDCECAAANETFMAGAWFVSVAPGVFESSNNFNFPFNAVDGTIDLVSTCNGELKVGYRDQEMGLVGWNLSRAAESGDTEILPDRIPDWADFVSKSPELNDFSDVEHVFWGTTTFPLSIGEVPAMMILAYAQNVGQDLTGGVGSITLRIGPAYVEGMGAVTFWARTGESNFVWAGPSDGARNYVREKCRCSEVERESSVQHEFLNINQQLLSNYATSDDGRVRQYWGQSLVDLKNRNVWNEVPPMENHNYDSSKPLNLEGNWPCLPVEDRVVDGEVGVLEFERQVEKFYNDNTRTSSDGDTPDHAHDAHDNGVPDGAAGVTDYNCNISFNDDSDYCAKPEIVLMGILAHEQVHANTCLGAKSAVESLTAELEQLASGSDGDDGIALAEVAKEANALQCVSVEGNRINSVNWLSDEIASIHADTALLDDYIGKYCE